MGYVVYACWFDSSGPQEWEVRYDHPDTAEREARQFAGRWPKRYVEARRLRDGALVWSRPPVADEQPKAHA